MSWLSRLFGRGRKPAPPADPIVVHGKLSSGPWTPSMVDDPDPYRRAMLAECMNSGGMVIGNRNNDGSLGIRTVKMPSEDR